MTTLLLKLAPIDFKNIRRDPLLVWIPTLPIIIASLIRWGVPALAAYLDRELGFDLTRWYPLLMSSFPVMMPGMVGMVVGFLLIDERDDGILVALLVTPMRPATYLAYRISLPLALGLAVTLVTYPLAGLTPLTPSALLAAALLGAFAAPFMALLLPSFAANKVTGFNLMKVANAVQLLPTIAYFVPLPWQLLAGLWPGYWSLKIVWQEAAGQSWGAYFVVGGLVNVAWIGALLRRFDRVVRR